MGQKRRCKAKAFECRDPEVIVFVEMGLETAFPLLLTICGSETREIFL